MIRADEFTVSTTYIAVFITRFQRPVLHSVALNIYSCRRPCKRNQQTPTTPRGGPPSDYVPLVNLISVFFQIRDDYMNLYSNEVSGLWIDPSRSARWAGRNEALRGCTTKSASSFMSTRRLLR
jgi:hypothetical protein